MVRVIHAVYDGDTLRPQEPLPFPPDTHLHVVVADLPAGEKRTSFVDAIGSLNLTGPTDWSENLEDYLYGHRDIDAPG